MQKVLFILPSPLLELCIYMYGCQVHFVATSSTLWIIPGVWLQRTSDHDAQTEQLREVAVNLVVKEDVQPRYTTKMCDFLTTIALPPWVILWCAWLPIQDAKSVHGGGYSEPALTLPEIQWSWMLALQLEPHCLSPSVLVKDEKPPEAVMRKIILTQCRPPSHPSW